MSINRTCPECGDPFTTTWPDCYYCSDDCSDGLNDQAECCGSCCGTCPGCPA